MMGAEGEDMADSDIILDRFSDEIGRDDMSELNDYFRMGGLSRLEKSPMSGMLERSSMFFCEMAPCVYCGGELSVDGKEEVSGSGFFVDVDSWPKEKRAKVEKHMGKKKVADGKLADGEVCEMCNMRGWREVGRRSASNRVLTAQPKKGAGVTQGAISNDNDVLFATCVRCASILDIADVLFPYTTQVLASICSGAKFGLLCLWHLTPVGKSMLRDNNDGIQEELFFAGIRGANELNEKKNVKKQLEDADEQAKQLKEKASKAWNAASFKYRY